MVSFAENTKRPIWIASGTVVNGVRQFSTPVLHHWNWRGLSSGVDMMTFGPEYMDYRRAVTTNDEIDGVKRLDRVWMDTTPSDLTDPLARDADFYVLSADAGSGGSLGSAVVTFKRLSPDGN